MCPDHDMSAVTVVAVAAMHEDAAYSDMSAFSALTLIGFWPVSDIIAWLMAAISTENCRAVASPTTAAAAAVSGSELLLPMTASFSSDWAPFAWW